MNAHTQSQAAHIKIQRNILDTLKQYGLSFTFK